MKQTAVEWLALKFSKSSEDELVGNINIWFGQAIQMAKQQQDEFAIGFAEWLFNIDKEALKKQLNHFKEERGL